MAAAPPYRQQSFYFLFAMPHTQGVAQWVSDIGTEPTDLSYPLILPDWFPRKTLLCHVWCGYGIRVQPTYPVEICMYVDPRGRNYNSGNGAEVWETMTRCNVMMQRHVGGIVDGTGMFQGFTDHRIDPPIMFNRDAGDKLWYWLAGNDTLDYAYFNLAFMVPNSFVPTPVTETA